MTCGHILDGTPFSIEKEIRTLAKWTNTVVIAVLDCCRLEQKGVRIVDEKVAGQLELIHAVEPGRAAIARPGHMSEVTASFIEKVKSSSLTFPASIKEWGVSHKTAQVLHKLKYEIELKVGTSLALKIPAKVSEWSPEDLVDWMKSIQISKVSQYEKVIVHTDNRFDGKWLLRYCRAREKLQQSIGMTNSDVDIVADELQKWQKESQQYSQ